MGNKDETISRVTVKMAISAGCNLNCIYCDGPNGRRRTLGAMEDFRRSPIKDGIITTAQIKTIIDNFVEAGFVRISFTGGEPLLNNDWDKIVNYSAKVGMRKVSLNTNGTLLLEYLNNHKGKLPIGLNLVKISVDTFDPRRFKKITGGGSIAGIINAIKFIRSNKKNSEVKLRANKVILKSDAGKLIEYINKCEEVGFDELNLLDLVLYKRSNYSKERKFFLREYISFDSVQKILKKQGIRFVPEDRFGGTYHQALLPSGFRILFKDSHKTTRSGFCKNCPDYCQIGLCLLYVATDGNVTTCPDYYGRMPAINAIEAMRDKTFLAKIKGLSISYVKAHREKSFPIFCKKNNIKYRNNG